MKRTATGAVFAHSPARGACPAFLVLLMVLLCLTGGGAFAASAPEADRPSDWARPVELPGSDNFYQVSDELYRAAQPDDNAMAAYDAYGIRTIINLRGFHSDKDEVKGTKLILVEIPVHTWKAGDDKVAVAALQAIRDAEKPVLVHCQHGADRTGLVIAMYRIVEQGWTREKALEELRNGGYGYHSIWRNIPEYLESVNIDAVRRALR